MGNCLNHPSKSNPSNPSDPSEFNPSNPSESKFNPSNPIKTFTYNEKTFPLSKKDLNDHAIKSFSLDGQWCLGYTVKVYDGDTYTINLNTSIGVHQWKIREYHIDTPEIKSNIPIEKLHAKTCRNIVQYLIGFKKCIVHCKGFEKYGRLLGRVYVKKTSLFPVLLTENCTLEDIDLLKENPDHPNFIDVGEWMLKNTPTLRYDGKKKDNFEFKDMKSYHSLYNQLFQTVLIDSKNDTKKINKHEDEEEFE